MSLGLPGRRGDDSGARDVMVRHVPALPDESVESILVDAGLSSSQASYLVRYYRFDEPEAGDPPRPNLRLVPACWLGSGNSPVHSLSS